jgi:cytoplasmic iron level regulating protein YaaA (DUF328/UPF0246 family)
MLYILFSPAESKNYGGKNNKLSDEILFSLEKREKILNSYNEISLSNDLIILKKLFGIKKESEIAQYANDIFNSNTMSAIERYSGVAYDYLDFSSLSLEQQKFIKDHTLIFSNLFGVLRAYDEIPLYKVKQGEPISEISPDIYYKDAYSDQLSVFLANHDVLDLRAGYYDKFYKVEKEYTTLKFLKNGKVVSHWAKAYRGIILREIAKANINSIEEFLKLDIENLQIQDIKKIKNKTEIVFNII